MTVFGTVRNVSAQVFAERERRRVETRRQDLLEALDKAGVACASYQHESRLAEIGQFDVPRNPLAFETATDSGAFLTPSFLSLLVVCVC